MDGPEEERFPGAYSSANAHGTASSGIAVSDFKYDLPSIVKKAKWLLYEVDPEWKSFCEFGPEDIGGPFEKLGIIRKRKVPAVLFLEPKVRGMIRSLEQAASDALLSISGIPVVESPFGNFAMFHPPASFIGFDPAVGPSIQAWRECRRKRREKKTQEPGG